LHIFAFLLYLSACCLVVRTVSEFIKTQNDQNAAWNEHHVSDVFLLVLENEAASRATGPIRLSDMQCKYFLSCMAIKMKASIFHFYELKFWETENEEQAMNKKKQKRKGSQDFKS
jgi:hypothetical protein